MSFRWDLSNSVTSSNGDSRGQPWKERNILGWSLFRLVTWRLRFRRHYSESLRGGKRWTDAVRTLLEFLTGCYGYRKDIGTRVNGSAQEVTWIKGYSLREHIEDTGVQSHECIHNSNHHPLFHLFSYHSALSWSHDMISVVRGSIPIRGSQPQNNTAARVRLLHRLDEMTFWEAAGIRGPEHTE